MNIGISCQQNTQIKRVRSRILKEIKLLDLFSISIKNVYLVFSFLPSPNNTNQLVECQIVLNFVNQPCINIRANSHSEVSAFFDAYEKVVFELLKMNELTTNILDSNEQSRKNSLKAFLAATTGNHIAEGVRS